LEEASNEPFEFMVTKCKSLNRISHNHDSFREHFVRNPKREAISFPSLGQDALMVTPLPRRGKDYKNLSQFTKNASESQ
jgi:hypothetical protein